MFLDVNRNTGGESAWKWVIGTDYNDRNSIIAECDLIGEHWSINGVNECSLGDNYVYV